MPVFSVNKSLSAHDLLSEKVPTNQKILPKKQIALPINQQSSRKEWIGIEELSELLHTTSLGA
jgi:hypothetical protein